MSKIKQALEDAEDFYYRLQRASESKDGMTLDQKAHFEMEYSMLKLKLGGLGFEKHEPTDTATDGH